MLSTTVRHSNTRVRGCARSVDFDAAGPHAKPGHAGRILDNNR